MSQQDADIPEDTLAAVRELGCILCGVWPCEFFGVFVPFDGGDRKVYNLCGDCKAIPDDERNARIENVFETKPPQPLS